VIASATLLLCHHGTRGAARAAALAFELAEPGRSLVVHCLVVPDLWTGMQGDDWLNNASTRDDFADYVEGVLERDAAAQIAEVAAACNARGLGYRSVLRVGDPAKCAVDIAREVDAGVVVIGPPRPKSEAGLRSRMELETLARGLHCPLVIANAA